MTTQAETKTKDFYVEKGMTRYTMILSKTHKEKIENVAKTYGITQGNVVEVLLDQMNVSLLGTHFETKRGAKSSRQGAKGAIVAKLKDMTPEQLKKVEAAIAAALA